MPKHTIELSKDEVRIINIVKALMDIKSIDKAISYIILDYADKKRFVKLIKEARKNG